MGHAAEFREYLLLLIVDSILDGALWCTEVFAGNFIAKKTETSPGKVSGTWNIQLSTIYCRLRVQRERGNCSYVSEENKLRDFQQKFSCVYIIYRGKIENQLGNQIFQLSFQLKLCCDNCFSQCCVLMVLFRIISQSHVVSSETKFVK